jgi:hypothetical protein
MAWRRLAPVFVLCLFPPLAGAQTQPHRDGPQKIARWVGSHKRLFVAGTALAAAAFADGYTTHRCLAAHRCRETNPLFGGHPSARRLWLEDGGFIAGEEVSLYFLDRWTRDSPGRFERNTALFGAAIPAGVHAWAASHNAQLSLRPLGCVLACREGSCKSQ